jgi:glycosyltransferase involved in cell wall biosynthesis
MTALDFGGTERQTLELVSRLDRARFQPRIVTLCGGAMPLLPKAQSLGVDCLCLTKNSRPEHDFRDLCTLPALWRFLYEERPPLLHLLCALPNIYGRIMAQILRLPGIMATCRGVREITTRKERFFKNLAHIHICNSAAIQGILTRSLHIPEKRVFYIPNGVDTDFFSPPASPSPSPSPIVLCIARMDTKVKNHALLLRAFVPVLAQAPNAELHLVGEGNLKPSLQQEAADLGIQSRVIFHGGAEDVRPFLHSAQVFALASDYEGMPNAALEAMACGLPVVCTRFDGSEEVVRHEKTGLLVPRGDAEALAEALLRLLKRPDERAAFGRAGREWTLGVFSLRHMVEGHERAYEYVLNRDS